ncbi:MAG: hypothetical protein E7812_08255 [Phenylobacterium sp.]|nr:MAG: hypothetical protein E7812_08255 [Phenylobacterium sp.]
MLGIYLAALLGAAEPAFILPVATFEDCHVWTAHRRSRAARDRDTMWLMGFVSGADLVLARPGDRMLQYGGDNPSDDIAVVDRYCASHPDARVEEAGRALVLKLKRRAGL